MLHEPTSKYEFHFLGEATGSECSVEIWGVVVEYFVNL